MESYSELNRLKDKLATLKSEKEFYLEMAQRSELQARYKEYADVTQDQIEKITRQISEMGGK